MPRLEESGLVNSASKFKKRRAWITEDPEPAVFLKDDSQPAEKVVNASDDCNMSITRLEHDYNKTVTRLEHDYNKTVTNNTQDLPDDFAPSNHYYNMTITRLEHDYNMTVTKPEHDHNKTITSIATDQFYSFLSNEREKIVDLEDHKSIIMLLSEVQRKIFWHTALMCISRDRQTTGPIEIKTFFSDLSISEGVVRTSLNRLYEKGMLQKEKGKLGKNGFAMLSLSKKWLESAREIFNNFNQKD